ncbi:MAG: hypothetical protein IT513_16365 [Burkholderiales bacterium]|nr:hypothetical protein [Burkholderiales bacterium]
MNRTAISRHCILLLLATTCGAAGAQGTGNPAMPCFRALVEDARFASLRGKVALGGALDELNSLTSSADRPTPLERVALGEWKSARDSCHRLEIPYFATRDTQIQALARDYFAAVQALIVELQGGKLSYGDFGRRRLDLYEKANLRFEEVRRSILPSKPGTRQPPGTKQPIQ